MSGRAIRAAGTRPPTHRAAIGLRLVLVVAISVACQSSAPPPAALSPSPVASAVPLGGVLRVDVATEPGSLDPLAASDPDAQLVMRQVYEGLVGLAPGAFSIVPVLATKWSASADGRTWTFTLRDGVRFHDGTSLDADAAASSLRRVSLPLAARVEASAPRTVTITTDRAYGPLLAQLALPSSAIASPSDRAAGTGPFAFVPSGWHRGSDLTVAANATYWQRDAAGRPLPYLDAVTFQLRDASAVRSSDLRTGAVHLATGLASGDVAAIRSNPNLKAAFRPSDEVVYLGMDLRSAPFELVAVRRAIAAAFNPRSIVDRALPDGGTPASQLLVPELIGHDESTTVFARYDFDTAKRLLVEGGVAGGFATELWYAPPASANAIDTRRIAEALAADLGRVGVIATTRSTDARALREGARSGRYPLWLDDHTLGLADPQPLLDAALGADSGWVNRPAQALLDAARGEVDPSKRAELYKQVSKLAQQDVPRIPILYAATALGMSRKVRGLVPQPLGAESLATVSLER